MNLRTVAAAALAQLRQNDTRLVDVLVALIQESQAEFIRDQAMASLFEVATHTPLVADKFISLLKNESIKIRSYAANS